LKFQAVAEKTAKDARGLLYFAAPGTEFLRVLYNIVRTVSEVDSALSHPG